MTGIAAMWQPDDSTESCMMCGQQFRSFFRRHHCRHCGKVVCSQCSKSRVQLTGHRQPLRMCVQCTDEFWGNDKRVDELLVSDCLSVDLSVQTEVVDESVRELLDDVLNKCRSCRDTLKVLRTEVSLSIKKSTEYFQRMMGIALKSLIRIQRKQKEKEKKESQTEQEFMILGTRIGELKTENFAYEEKVKHLEQVVQFYVTEKDYRTGRLRDPSAIHERSRAVVEEALKRNIKLEEDKSNLNEEMSTLRKRVAQLEKQVSEWKQLYLSAVE